MKKINLMIPIVLSLVTTVLAHTGEDDFAHHSMMGGMGGMMSGTFGMGGMFFGWIFGLLIIVALVLLIIWLVKQIQKK